MYSKLSDLKDPVFTKRDRMNISVDSRDNTFCWQSYYTVQSFSDKEIYRLFRKAVGNVYLKLCDLKDPVFTKRDKNEYFRG